MNKSYSFATGLSARGKLYAFCFGYSIAILVLLSLEENNLLEEFLAIVLNFGYSFKLPL